MLASGTGPQLTVTSVMDSYFFHDATVFQSSAVPGGVPVMKSRVVGWVTSGKPDGVMWSGGLLILSWTSLAGPLPALQAARVPAAAVAIIPSAVRRETGGGCSRKVLIRFIRGRGAA